MAPRGARSRLLGLAPPSLSLSDSQVVSLNRLSLKKSAQTLGPFPGLPSRGTELGTPLL